VFLADDHPIVRKGLSCLENRSNLEVVAEAVDGREALKKPDEMAKAIEMVDASPAAPRHHRACRRSGSGRRTGCVPAEPKDDKGGTAVVTQAVMVVTCPLNVLNLGGFQANGAFKICMLGRTGSNYQLLASTDLSSTNWDAIGVMEFTNGIWRYLDYDATTHVSRYYRAKQLP
jgi:DNA-binding NarL/FixJ family response regulator